MNFFKRTAAIALAVALLLSGCAGGNTTWAYKSGDTPIPTGLYILYEISSIAGLEAKINEENPETAMTEAQKPSALLKMTVEGQPAADWVSAETEKNVREYFAVKQQFEAMGLQLDENDLAAIEYNVKSILAQNADFYEKVGVSEASLTKFYEGYVRRHSLFDTLYGEGGEYAVSESELKEYFEKNYAMADAVPFYKPYIVPEGETSTLDELEVEAKQDAEESLKRLQAGEEIEQIAYDWQLKNTDEANRDSVEKPTKEDLRVIVSDADRANFGDAFIDAIFETEVGTSALVEETSFYALFTRVDIMEEDAAFEDYKETLLHILKDDEFNTKLLEWGAGITMESNSATINKYQASKLKLDDI